MSNTSDISTWKAIQLTKKVTRTPYISINQKVGRVGFNMAACNLIPEIFFFPYCTPLHKEDEQGNVSVGFLFSKDPTDNCLNLHKTMSKGDHPDVTNAFIYSKPLAEEIAKYLGFTEDNAIYHASTSGKVILYATQRINTPHPNSKGA